MAQQVMPDSLVYTLESPTIGQPSAYAYQTALDAANKNVASPNDSSFKAVGGSAGIKVQEPILVQKTVVKEVPTFSLMKTAICIGVLYLGYHFFKGKSL